jgi:hypothetical protein
MDFLDPKKKRSSVIRLYIGYGLMTILIVIGAVVLLYAAFGYGVNKDGEVYQNSTVFLASDPSGADASIKNNSTGEVKSVTTNDRLTLPQGDYKVDFTKSGYRPWVKSVELRGGQISRLDYAFLFPKRLIAKDIAKYSVMPGLITTSPDRSKQLIQKPNSSLQFDLFDNNNLAKPPILIELSNKLFSGLATSSEINLVEWSNDNRHVLLSYRTRSGNKFVLIDTKSPENSININTKYTKNFISVRLRDKSPDNLYLLSSDGTLKTGSLKNATLQKVLSNVGQFQPYKNDLILFINNRDSQKKTKSVKAQLWDSGKGLITIKELPQSNKYFIDLADYDGDLYVAVGASSGRDEMYVFRDPFSSAEQKGDPAYFARTLRLEDIQQLSFSINARFICTQSGSSFDIYDAEDDRQYKFSLDKKYTDVDSHKWMDGHRLIVNSIGNVVEFDFDGTNVNELTKSINNEATSFNGDYSAMSAIAPATKKSPYIFQSFELRVK